MRNWWRVAAFDIAAPLAAIAGLLAVGAVLGWPLWWVSACSVLALLIVEGMAVNFVLWRRDAVTVGTDDDGPGLRLGVVALSTAALVAAVLLGYTRWTVPDRDFDRDSARVVQVAVEVAELTASFSPQSPAAAIDKAVALVVPDRAAAFKDGYTKFVEPLARHNATAQAETVSAGVEGLGPSDAMVAVILRVTTTVPGEPIGQTTPGLRIMVTKHDGQWLVRDLPTGIPTA